MTKHIEEAVEKIVQDIVRGSELEVVDVEYVKERDWYLRVYLDKEGGIEIDDCQRFADGGVHSRSVFARTRSHPEKGT